MQAFQHQYIRNLLTWARACIKRTRRKHGASGDTMQLRLLANCYLPTDLVAGGCANVVSVEFLEVRKHGLETQPLVAEIDAVFLLVPERRPAAKTAAAVTATAAWFTTSDGGNPSQVCLGHHSWTQQLQQ
jgi:hypothetical protein